MNLKKSFYENIDNRANRNRLQSRRYFTGRLWSQRNFYRGKGNAGADGDPREICAAETAGRGAHHWIVAHDDSDRGVDRDTYRSWRERSMGKLQHFFHARSCCRGHGQDRKSTRLNSSHVEISYAVFCLKKKTK